MALLVRIILLHIPLLLLLLLLYTYVRYDESMLCINVLKKNTLFCYAA